MPLLYLTTTGITKTWSSIPPQPTLFRQSSPFAFASTSTSITTESGRVTWQSILAVSKIFGVPLFQKTIHKKKKTILELPLGKITQTPYIKPSSLSQTLPLRVADLRATSCRLYQWNAMHGAAYSQPPNDCGFHVTAANLGPIGSRVTSARCSGSSSPPVPGSVRSPLRPPLAAACLRDLKWLPKLTCS